jgi:multidrug resistance efflux pump
LHSYLPPGPPSINPSILLNAIQNSQNTQRLTSLARESINQNEHLRHISTVAGKQQAQLSQAIRADQEVKQAIVDYRLGEASTAQARNWVEEGWNGLMEVQMERQIT